MISYYKNAPPIDIDIFEEALFYKGIIGYHNANMDFIPVIVASNDANGFELEFCIINIRIINPKNSPVSIFNLQVLDEKNNLLNYHKQIDIPYISEISKLIIIDKKQTNNTLGINLPYSHYTTIPGGCFAHLDIVIPINEITENDSKVIKVFFRDSRRTFLTVIKRKLKSNAKLKYPIHYKEINLSYPPKG